MAALAERIEQWIREKVDESGTAGVAVGLSGGIDSAVAAGLASRALGPERVHGVIMPAHSQPVDIRDAERAAEHFGMSPLTIDLSAPFDSIIATVPEGNHMAVANVKPRLRMITLYHIANTNNLLVLGTGNKSELMVGYFTKYGDGGVDLLPLGSLYKSEVRQLARAIGVPQDIIDRPPSAGLWAGQTDEEEMGISYEELDAILAALEQGDASAYPPERVQQVREMVRRSEHKRSMPPIFELSRPLSMLERA